MQQLLLDCLDEVRAEEEMHHRQMASDLSPDRVYYLTYLLTKDREQAAYARAKQWLAMDRETAMRQIATEMARR